MPVAENSIRLQTALRSIAEAKTYTDSVLDSIDAADWFRMPAEGVTHVAWQAGHLAMAKYRLALERMRGTQPGDDELISPEFLALFGKGSTPEANPAKYPSPAEIRSVLERVHSRALRELAGYPDDQLDLPPHKTHRLFNDRLGSLLWCARHEMLHTGQIALLRRLFGAAPQW